MIESAEEFKALRCSEEPAEYHRAAHDEASEAVWLDVINRFPDMRLWVVHNKTVPQRILWLLSDDPDRGIRSAIATKRKCEPALFWKLAKDPDESVRLRVAVNKKTPVEILYYLVNDPWERVAEVARTRLSELNAT